MHHCNHLLGFSGDTRVFFRRFENGILEVHRDGAGKILGLDHRKVFIEVNHSFTQGAAFLSPGAIALHPFEILDHGCLDMSADEFEAEYPRITAFDGGMAHIVLAAQPAGIEIFEQIPNIPNRPTHFHAGVVLVSAMNLVTLIDRSQIAKPWL